MAAGLSVPGANGFQLLVLAESEAPSEEPATSLDVLRERKRVLQQRIQQISEEILDLRSRFPCTLERELSNEAWIQEKRSALRIAIESEKRRAATLEEALKQALAEAEPS